MGLEFVSKIFLLHLLLVTCTHASVDNDAPHIEMRGGHPDAHAHAHPSPHLHHISQSAMLFFTVKDIKVGKTMPLYFEKKDPSKSPHFLPREEADAIPFSSEALPDLLQFFSFSKGSPQALGMEMTFRQCESKPIKGETSFCATSLESLLDFARGIFGYETPFKVATTTFLTNSNVEFQNYTIIEEPKAIPAPKMIACHSMSYPYLIYYCHSQMSKNRVYMLNLRGDNGHRVEAASVCHMDTSQWNRDHVSFSVLGIKPGSSSVCHIFPADNLLFLPRA